MDNKLNIVIAVFLSVLVIGGWSYFFPPIMPPAQKPDTITKTTDTGQLVIEPRDVALKQSQRVMIDSPTLSGSINLEGLRFDDIRLKKYFTAIDKKNEVILLSPSNSPDGYIAQLGWLSSDPRLVLPNSKTRWQANKKTLTAGDKVVFTTSLGNIGYRVEVAMDDQYLFTINQTIQNRGLSNEDISFYGLLARFGDVELTSDPLVSEGGIMNINDNFVQKKYQAMKKDFSKSQAKGDNRIATTKLVGDNGWLGFSDKYWLVALSPQLNDIDPTNRKTVAASQFTATAGYDNLQATTTGNAQNIGRYQIDYTTERETLPRRQAIDKTIYLYVGPKIASLLENYSLSPKEGGKGINRFDLAIDYGRLYILTKPMATLLHWLSEKFASVGIAIIILTIIVRIALFPLAQKSFASLANMKKIAPQVNELKKRHGNDNTKMSQAMMALYKKEKVNPLAGCLPMLVQIPVFFALYRVFTISIEFRHTPFVGWVHDLSAPDPLGLLTLFGLLPWSVPPILTIINIGIWPIIMGITLLLQQKLNPPIADPTQAKIFAWFPYIFTFMLGSSPVGVVIYWSWSNLLSIVQQYYLNVRLGLNDGPSLKNLFKKKK